MLPLTSGQYKQVHCDLDAAKAMVGEETLRREWRAYDAPRSFSAGGALPETWEGGSAQQGGLLRSKYLRAECAPRAGEVWAVLLRK